MSNSYSGGRSWRDNDNKRGRGGNKKYNAPKREKDITLQRCLFKRAQSDRKNNQIRIASYNILADSLLYDNIYLYSNNSKLPKEKQPYYFEWEYRKELLLQQFVGPRPRTNAPRIFERLKFSNDQLVKPELFCLQELDKYSEFAESLEDYNYDSIYKKRTGKRKDGCAIFYNKDIMKLLKYHVVEFNRSDESCLPLLSDRLVQLNATLEEIQKQTPSKIFLNLSEDGKSIICKKEENQILHVDEIMDRDNVAIIGLFQLCSDPSKIFCVATTHLLFNPKRGDIKFLQIDLLLHEIFAFLNQNNFSPTDIPIIVCGDYNSSQYSDIYNYMNGNHITITPQNPYWRYEVGGIANDHKKYETIIVNSIEELEMKINQEVKGNNLFKYYENLQKHVRYYYSPTGTEIPQNYVFKHPFLFSSAYAKHGGEPFCTTSHKMARETVDYLWFTNIACNEVLSITHLPEEEFVDRKVVIPHRFHPSDHFMLAGDFYV